MLARLNDEDDRPLSFLFGMLGLSTRFGFVSCLKENGCFCERSDRAGYQTGLHSRTHFNWIQLVGLITRSEWFRCREHDKNSIICTL